MEGPLYMPKVVICCVYILYWYIRISEIAFRPSHLESSANTAIVDGDFHFTIHRQKLIVTSLLILPFCERTMFISLFQPAYSFLYCRHLSLHGHLYSRPERRPPPFIFNHLAVALGLFQYPAFDLLTFILLSSFILYTCSRALQVPLYWHCSSVRICHHNCSPNRIYYKTRLSSSSIVWAFIFVSASWMQYASG